jgi:hypothetical protein
MVGASGARPNMGVRPDAPTIETIMPVTYEIISVDDLVKSRHSRAGGNPESPKLSKRLDSRFHGNDGEAHFQTFYEVISVDICNYS